VRACVLGVGGFKSVLGSGLGLMGWGSWYVLAGEWGAECGQVREQGAQQGVKKGARVWRCL